jgi:V8-like Glu-specific endopeptidase
MRKLIKFFVLIILFSLLAGCAYYINPLYNWKPINTADHPNVIAITNEAGKMRCSGVVIRPNVVLTAGHCLEGMYTENFRIVSHCSNIRNKHCTLTKVKQKAFYPNYKRGHGVWSDIGLLILEDDLKDIKPAQIGTLDDIKRETPLISVGFGRRTDGKIGILYAGKNAIHDNNLYEIKTYIGGENGTCSGDSGSPTFVKTEEGLKLVGILSRSTRVNAPCGGISVYTVPILYWDWIEEIITITK